MSLFLGIDSGTQSVKAVVYDAESKRVISDGRASHSLIKNLPSGHMEQNPDEWTQAMDIAILQALDKLTERLLRESESVDSNMDSFHWMSLEK